jgi:hypothetical protein
MSQPSAQGVVPLLRASRPQPFHPDASLDLPSQINPYNDPAKHQETAKRLEYCLIFGCPLPFRRDSLWI